MDKVKDITYLGVGELDPAPFNPNKMSERKFNQLVQRIKEQGFKDPVSVVPTGEGRYRIIEGEHRWKSARFLEIEKIPCFVHDNWDEDKQKFEIVKSNVLKGEMDAIDFTKLVDSLSAQYNKEVIQEMMGFQDEKEFKRVYKEIKQSLPKELQKKLEESKEEIKTIEDLSLVLNRMFNEYGDTLEQNFMILDYGGKDSLWIRADKNLWREAQKLKYIVTENKSDMSNVMLELLSTDKSVNDFKILSSEEDKPQQETEETSS